MKPSGEQVKKATIDLINKLNELCFKGLSVPGPEHQARSQAVEECIKTLEGFELFEIAHQDETSVPEQP